MTKRIFHAALLALAALAPAAALADWPPMFWEEVSTAETAAPAGAQPVLFSVPDGSGAPFTQARVVGGQIVDATITLYLRDPGGNPIVGVPAIDMWLEKEILAGSGSFPACPYGTTADGPTDADGIARWAMPLEAGGWSTSRTLVLVWGQSLATNTGLILRHNSPDLNGDLVVNLSDVPLFAADFMSGTNAFRSDLHFDGQVNLSDIPRLAGAMGRGCP